MLGDFYFFSCYFYSAAKELTETIRNKEIIQSAQEVATEVAEGAVEGAMERASKTSNSDNGMSAGNVQICSGMGAQEGGCPR